MRRKTPYGEVEQRTVEVQEWLITPEIAREILKKNVRNRNLSTDRVQSYEWDMKTQNWEEKNPQNAIVLSENGELKDGQHRLTALIKADVCLWFKVYITTDNYQIDRGRPRSFADTSRMNGLGGRYIDSKAVGAAKFLAVIKNGDDARKARVVSDKKCEETMSKNADKWEAARRSVQIGHANRGANNGIKRSACIAALYCALVYGVPVSTIDRFCEVANTGLPRNESEYAAVIFGRNIKQGHNGSTSNAKEFNACQEALVDFVDGRKRIRAYPGVKSFYFDEVKEKI